MVVACPRCRTQHDPDLDLGRAGVLDSLGGSGGGPPDGPVGLCPPTQPLPPTPAVLHEAVEVHTAAGPGGRCLVATGPLPAACEVRGARTAGLLLVRRLRLPRRLLMFTDGLPMCARALKCSGGFGAAGGVYPTSVGL